MFEGIHTALITPFRNGQVDEGALLAQDWAGFGQVSPAHYLTAAEVEDGTVDDEIDAL